MKSQVTTKRGDTGCTTAISGDAYPKSHIIMECAGTLDELRAHTALLRLHILDEKPDNHQELDHVLLWLLHVYFLIGSACSDPLNKHPEYRKRDVTASDVEKLEAHQLRLEARTPLPHSFMMSAGNTLAAQADIACTVCRRFERNLVRLKETFSDFTARDLTVFVNRLSDTLYMLARSLEHPLHQTVDYSLLDT